MGFNVIEAVKEYDELVKTSKFHGTLRDGSEMEIKKWSLEFPIDQ